MTLLLSLLKQNLYALLYLYTTSSIFCSILALSATNTIPSANKSKLSTTSPYLAPPTFFTSFANSSIKIEKRIGDKIQPCLSPTSKENQSVFSFPSLTQLLPPYINFSQLSKFSPLSPYPTFSSTTPHEKLYHRL